MSEYSKKFKDPRWQKKRLEVLEERFWGCENCETEDKTLNVHHVVYFKNKDPWEYDSEYLKVLCEKCHAETHNIKEKIEIVLGDLDTKSMLRVLGYAIANLDGPFEHTAETNEERLGLCDYYRTNLDALTYGMSKGGFMAMSSIYRQAVYIDED